MSSTSHAYAFDKKSARSFDADGRMRVRDCVISVAEVNPYYGRHIPGHVELGLDPNRIYNLYRDPAALEAAVDSFNGLPLMIKHVVQTAKHPRKEYQGGSVYNVRYDAPNLRADLLISDGEAIEYVESDVMSDLSAGYLYKPEMIPGVVDGVAYDGRMLAIEGNHVALVEDGRATGAHVADSALLSQPGETIVDPNANPGGNADLAAAVLALTEKLDAVCADMAELRAGSSPRNALDESEEDKQKALDEAAAKAKEDERAGEERAMDSNIQTKVDAAVAAAVQAAHRQRDELEAAKRAVRPVLGDTIAMDNAGDVYRAALVQKGFADADIAPGTELAAWRGFVAGSSVRATHAMDARTPAGEKTEPFFKTSHIRNRG